MSTINESASSGPADGAELGTDATSDHSGARSTELAGNLRLSTLGKRIEMLRVDRGVSKQLLARAAGTSRQQLWRVMTGKSELTTTLCQRLASVLDVDSRTLSSVAFDLTRRSSISFPTSRAAVEPSPVHTLEAYLASSTSLVRTLRSLPGGDDGAALKRALLNAVEDRARMMRMQIPAWLFRVRASVLDGSL